MKSTHRKTVLTRILSVFLCLTMIAATALVVRADTVDGDIEKVKFEIGKDKYSTYGYVFHQPIKRCTSLELEIELYPRAGAYCQDWQVWVKSYDVYSESCTLYLPEGKGKCTKTIYFHTPTTVDAIAITPKKSGNFSWDLSVNADAVCESPFIGSASVDADSVPGMRTGYWESVKIKADKTFNTKALILDEPVEGASRVTIDMDVELNRNAYCQDWQIWVRKNGEYIALDTLYLETGRGSTSKTIRLKHVTDFDAVAITPLKPGNYSWEIDIAVRDVK